MRCPKQEVCGTAGSAGRPPEEEHAGRPLVWDEPAQDSFQRRNQPADERHRMRQPAAKVKSRESTGFQELDLSRSPGAPAATLPVRDVDPG